MLVIPKFMNYERPVGYEPDYPQVLVRQGVIKKFDEVTVAYEGLATFFEALKKSAEKTTTVLYHSDKFGEGVLPKQLQHTPHVPFSDTYHINTWAPFSYAQVDGVRRPRPANVMRLLTDSVQGSFGAAFLGEATDDYPAFVREHAQDIHFPAFSSPESE